MGAQEKYDADELTTPGAERMPRPPYQRPLPFERPEDTHPSNPRETDWTRLRRSIAEGGGWTYLIAGLATCIANIVGALAVGATTGRPPLDDLLNGFIGLVFLALLGRPLGAIFTGCLCVVVFPVLSFATRSAGVPPHGCRAGAILGAIVALPFVLHSFYALWSIVSVNFSQAFGAATWCLLSPLLFQAGGAYGGYVNARVTRIANTSANAAVKPPRISMQQILWITGGLSLLLAVLKAAGLLDQLMLSVQEMAAGFDATRFALSLGAWITVSAVTYMPAIWIAQWQWRIRHKESLSARGRRERRPTSERDDADRELSTLAATERALE